MQIIPALYLSRGNCVSHYKGEAGQSTILSSDPIASARSFEREGASAIHLVNLDDNIEIAKRIAKLTHLSVQYADGISSYEMIADILNCGIAAVSINQFSEFLLEKAIRQFGSERILFTIRAQRNAIEEKEGIEVVDYGLELENKGVTQLIFRDTKVEGTLHPNFDEVDRLVLGTSMKIFAFGGIASTEDLAILAKVGVAGVIISRALLEGKLSLRGCIQQFR